MSTTITLSGAGLVTELAMRMGMNGGSPELFMPTIGHLQYLFAQVMLCGWSLPPVKPSKVRILDPPRSTNG